MGAPPLCNSIYQKKVYLGALWRKRYTLDALPLFVLVFCQNKVYLGALRRRRAPQATSKAIPICLAPLELETRFLLVIRYPKAAHELTDSVVCTRYRYQCT